MGLRTLHVGSRGRHIILFRISGEADRTNDVRRHVILPLRMPRVSCRILNGRMTLPIIGLVNTQHATH